MNKRPFWPTKQPGKANQRSKEASLPSGQKGHGEKSVQTRNAEPAMEKGEPCYADGRDGGNLGEVDIQDYSKILA